MYLSKIIITNFKTILGSIEIEFSKSMTLLTGNNGVGKSNILDAIMFALGGQDERQEGTAIELICTDFNTHRRLADFCEVSLYFKNGGTVDELISITRQLRVPKSGRIYSVYKLNGNIKSRSEIHDYLKQFGIEPNGFNMVKQGEISTRKSESPESRKQLIEQISGIAQYDPKIMEAEAKINNAKNTLRHVELLIEEANKRMSNYKKDRDKALKYRKIKYKINYNRALKLGTVINKLEEKISTYNSELNEKYDKINDYKQQIINFNEQLVEIKKIIDDQLRIRLDFEKEKMQMVGASSIQIQNLENLNKNIFNIKERISDSKKKIEVLQTSTKKDLMKTKKKLKKEFSQLLEKDSENKKVSSDLQFEIIQLEDKLPRLEEEYQNLIEERDKINKLLEDYEKKKNEIDNERIQWKNKIDIFTSRRDEMKENVETLQNRIEGIQRNLHNLQNKILRMKKEKTVAERFLNDSRGKVSTLISQIQDIEYQLSEKINKRNELEINLKKSKPRYSEVVSKLLELRDQKKIPGIIGTVLELMIEIDRNYALAIEIASGNKLQNIVISNFDTMLEIIDYIKENDMGQVSFYPLDILGDIEKKSIPRDNNVLGRIIDFIKYKPEYSKIFEIIFQNTLLVKDIETAKKYKDYGCVTIYGDLIDPNGEMNTMGQFDSRFLLINEFYRRKINELNQIITEIENRLKLLKKQINTLTSQRERNDRRRLEIIEEIAKINGRIIELEKLRNDSQPSLDKVLPKYRQIQDDLNEAITNYENLDIELGQIIEKIRNLNFKKAEIQKSINETEYGDVENQIKEKKEQVAALHRKILSFQKEYNNYNNRIIQIDSKINLIDNQILEIQDQIKEKEEEKNKLIEEKEKLDSIINEQKEKYNTIDLKIQEINEKLDEVQKERSEIVQKKVEIDSEIEKINTEINEINRVKSTIEERRKNIIEKIESLGVKITEFERINLDELDKRIEILENEISLLGPVDPTAPEKFEAEKRRLKDLTVRRNKCVAELESSSEVYDELYRQKEKIFLNTLEKLNKNLKYIFNKIHPKGSIELITTQPKTPLNGGIDIKVDMGSGVVSSTRSLSGGQNSVVAASIIFAIQRLFKRSVWYFLDEIDAHLDDTHCEALGKLLKELSKESQYIITTPRKSYLREYAQRIYSLWKKDGITKISCIKREDFN
ncbi:MAG: AAA family ATPase [Candidatus Helarchaeota archaeon]